MKNNDTFLVTFFNNLNKNNINYCVLRNYETLPNNLNGSDLDILISKNDIKKFYDLLDKVLFQTNGKIITKYGKLTPRVCVSGFYNNQYFGVQLDVHEGILPYKIYEMFPVNFLINRANTYNDIKVANDDDASILAFFKEVLNNKICKQKYFDEAKKSWNKDVIYKNELSKIYTEEFICLIEEIFCDDFNFGKIKKLSNLGRESIINSFSKKLKVLFSNIERSNRFFKTPGFTIAILGTDGAGKSTIIENIWAPLNESMHNSMYYEHMRPNLIPNIAQLFGKKKETIPVTNPHKSKPSGTIGSLIRLFYYTIDYTLGYFLKVYKINVKKSSIWIFDRYFYDYMIDQRRARIKLPESIIKLISLIIPKPDLIICLGTDAKKIHERKPELAFEEVEKQVNKLKEFSLKTKNTFWIDTGCSIEKSSLECFNLIISNMSNRYK